MEIQLVHWVAVNSHVSQGDWQSEHIKVVISANVPVAQPEDLTHVPSVERRKFALQLRQNVLLEQVKHKLTQV